MDTFGKPFFGTITNFTKEDLMPNVKNVIGVVSNYTKDTIVPELVNAYPWYSRAGIVLGGILLGALTFPILASLGLCLLGFTCWGIMAGSAAACCQSSMGDVPAGSCFSCVQGAGAGGLGIWYLILAIPGAILGGYLAVIYTADTIA